jgi:PEP-CTERM motif
MTKFRLFALAAFAAAICSASPVTYSNTAVTCKEFVPNITTENLTVTVDSALNGGTITAGSQASNNCYFKINGNALAAPFANGNYNYTSAQDIVCWHTGGFCVTGSQLVTLNIADTAGGKLFTIVSASITTTFVLGAPDGGGSPVPEPQSLALLGTGLIGFGLVSRRKKA